MRKFLKILILMEFPDGRGTIIRQKSRTSRMLQKLSHDIFGLMRLLIFLTMPIVRKT